MATTLEDIRKGDTVTVTLTVKVTDIVRGTTANAHGKGPNFSAIEFRHGKPGSEADVAGSNIFTLELPHNFKELSVYKEDRP